jgi:hypothetical protein
MEALISYVKLVLSFLELLEEWRDLIIMEWNFKEILCDKLVNLLHQQRIYWKQRGSIKWIKLGDGNTSFFHANASIKHRKNLITSLQDHTSNLVQDHHLKADILWKSFKDRLGATEFQGMLFDLPSLFGPGSDLHSLVQPFTNQEIDSMFKLCPQINLLGMMGLIINLSKSVGESLSMTSTNSAWISIKVISVSEALIVLSSP